MGERVSNWERMNIINTVDCENNRCSYCKGVLTSKNEFDSKAHEFCKRAMQEHKEIPSFIEKWYNIIRLSYQ